MTTRRTTRARAYAPDPAATPGRPCDSPGCAAEGAYRAPKSRSTLNEYHWFCLEHVRAYNASWDFYKGMSAGQIEAQTRADTGWQRPTWPLGTLGRQSFDETNIADPLHLLATGRIHRESARPKTRVPAQLREPIQTLGLEWPVAMDVLKIPLQGTRQAPPPRRQWRRPRGRGTPQIHQPRLRRRPPLSRRPTPPHGRHRVTAPAFAITAERG